MNKWYRIVQVAILAVGAIFLVYESSRGRVLAMVALGGLVGLVVMLIKLHADDRRRRHL